MFTLNESESEVVRCRSYTFLVRYASRLKRSIPLFNPLSGLAKIVEAMHGLSQLVQLALIGLIGFAILCMTIVAIICHLN